MGGGTQGHIFPLLAVMEAVQKELAVDCVYIGQKKDMQSPAIRSAAIPFKTRTIRAGKLNRFITWKHFAQAVNFLLGLIQGRWIIFRLKPDLVFSKGGFVSVPIVMAATAKGIPVVSHETDLIPGMANRLAAKRVRKICTAFPAEAYRQLPQSKLVYTGQPVRKEFFEAKSGAALNIKGRELRTDRPIVVSTGGSQGAHRLNEIVKEAWLPLLEQAVLVHISGEKDYESLIKEAAILPKKLQENLYIASFVDEVAELFKQSAVIVSRAGGSVMELAAVAKPVILVPLSTAAQDHQAANAKFMQDRHAAMVIDERTGTGEDLSQKIMQILTSPDIANNLAANIAKLARPNAAADIAKVIKESIREIHA